MRPANNIRLKIPSTVKRQSQSYISTDSNWCRPILVPIQKWCSFNTIFVLALRQIGLLFESKNHTVNIYVHVYFANSFRTLPLGVAHKAARVQKPNNNPSNHQKETEPPETTKIQPAEVPPERNRTQQLPLKNHRERTKPLRKPTETGDNVAPKTTPPRVWLRS